VRPSTLTNEVPRGIRSGLAIPYGDVSRQSLANVLAALVDRPHINRMILELTDGSEGLEDVLD